MYFAVEMQYMRINEVRGHGKHREEHLTSYTFSKWNSASNAEQEKLSVQDSFSPQTLSMHSDVVAAGRLDIVISLLFFNSCHTLRNASPLISFWKALLLLVAGCVSTYIRLSFCPVFHRKNVLSVL